MSESYRIVGPPGTGKTTALARYIAQAAAKRGPDALLAASFTRAAANELRGRDLPIPREQVGTLHALCYRALGQPKLAAGNRAFLDAWNAAYPSWALGRVSEDAYEEGAGTGQQLLEALDGARGHEQATMADLARHPLPDIQRFAVAWSEAKADAGVVDFTDLIEWALADGVPPPGNPRVGVLDEAQDCSALEMRLWRQWAARMDVSLVAGDMRQCLYQFRGASPEVFMEGDDAHRRVLAQSYRLPRAVHSRAVAWAARLAVDDPAEYRPRDAAGVAAHDPHLLLADGRGCAERVVELLQEHAGVMLLASCAYLLELPNGLLPALRAAGIPYHNPYAEAQGKWNPLRLGGKHVSTAARVQAYLQCRATGTWTEDALALWTPLLQADGVLVRGQKQTLARLAGKRPLGRDVLTDYFQHDALAGALSGDLEWLRGHATGQYAQRLAYPCAIAAHQGVAALTATPKVIVGTIHSVKGGEAPAVVLWPDLSRAGAAEWQGQPHQRDAVIRQFYVGMTRARETLVIGGSSSRWAVPIGR